MYKYLKRIPTFPGNRKPRPEIKEENADMFLLLYYTINMVFFYISR